jgi:hypothetical protein
MNSGPLLRRRPIKSGYGWLFVEKRAKLLDMRWVIVMKSPVANYGSRYQRTIVGEDVILISGKPIERSFQPQSTVQSEKKPEKPHILNGSTIPCVSDWHALFAKLSRSQNRSYSMKSA